MVTRIKTVAILFTALRVALSYVPVLKSPASDSSYTHEYMAVASRLTAASKHHRQYYGLALTVHHFDDTGIELARSKT